MIYELKKLPLKLFKLKPMQKINKKLNFIKYFCKMFINKDFNLYKISKYISLPNLNIKIFDLVKCLLTDS